MSESWPTTTEEDLRAADERALAEWKITFGEIMDSFYRRWLTIGEFREIKKAAI